MFGLGFSEILVILVVALLVFGPKRLPEIARTLGKSMGELRRALDEVRSEVSRVELEPPSTPTERAAQAPKETLAEGTSPAGSPSAETKAQTEQDGEEASPEARKNSE